MYPEGLHYLERFACREFCVGYFQISKTFKDVCTECGGRDIKVTNSLSWEETLLVYSFISLLSETL